MKVILTVFFIFLSVTSQAQYNSFKNCEEAVNQAKSDIENGIIKRVMTNPDIDIEFDFEFEYFYEFYLFSKYNIESIRTGCFYNETDNCYFNEMKNYINETLGNDFYKSNLKQLEEIYKLSSFSEKAKLIDLSKAYYNLDSYPKFKGNDKIIEKFIEHEFNLLNPETSKGIYFIISTKGKVIDMLFTLNDIEKPIKNKVELIKKVNTFGDWIPGYLYNIKVKSKVGI